jgi:hypothetical protein
VNWRTLKALTTGFGRFVPEKLAALNKLLFHMLHIRSSLVTNVTHLALLAVISSTLIWGQSVVSFTLIDAATGQPVPGHDPLLDGTALDLGQVPPRLTIRANTNPATVGSVRFGLNGTLNYRIENQPPYALEGDISGVYTAWTAAAGSYIITATPFSGLNGSGSTGIARTISLSLKQSSDVVSPPTSGSVVISGELKQWHAVTLTFTGPSTSEVAVPNPFSDYRLNVTFVHSASGQRCVVPGYYAADGSAAETGATGGDKWRVHFMPDQTGVWNYEVSFRAGKGIATDSNALAGVSTSFDGATGSITIGTSDKKAPDFRSRGLLRYVGRRYLQFAGTGEYFLQAGPGSPENLLAYADFDGTHDASGGFLHAYAPHVADWRSGDPAWRGGSKGKGIIGALNYLNTKGMNSLYFLTYNLDGGDGMDVWPWSGVSVRDRFDVSKLAQWELVFAHMDRLGIAMFLFTQETENNLALDGGFLGPIRMLYYRELIARFGHHLALTWNLGEENTNSDAQRKSFAQYIRSIDPYDHPISVHTHPGQQELVFSPLRGFGQFEHASLQVDPISTTHSETIRWLNESAAAGRPWLVTMDENGPASSGVLPDSYDPNHDQIRSEGLWGNLMAGGAGVHWYYGYSYPHNDLVLEDFRSRDRMYTQTRHAIDFFRNYLPFAEMAHADALTSSSSDFVLAKPGEIYAVYLPVGGTTDLNLGTNTATFTVQWFDPRTGGALQMGTVSAITGPNSRNIGRAPFSGDAVALIRKTDGSPVGGTFQPIRVNTGGERYTDPQGNVWSADTGYSGGAIYVTSYGISNTTTPALYQNERYNTGPLTYTFSVPNGIYTVTLKFAEIWFTAAGKRVFHIVLNGQTVQSNFDIAAQAGGAFRAIDRTFTVNVGNGQLSIQLLPSVENTTVHAIEIR